MSRCKSGEEREHEVRTQTTSGHPSELRAIDELKLDPKNQRLVDELLKDLSMEVVRCHPIPTPTVIYACSDCYYTETYLVEDMFTRTLDSYDGWERVSPPAMLMSRYSCDC